MRKSSQIISMLLALLCVLSILLLPAGATASTDIKNCSVQVVGQSKLYVEGNPVRYAEVAKQTMPILNYQYTNYVPAATAGEWMGKTVSWDKGSRTLNYTGTITAQVAVADKIPELSGSVSADLYGGITITIDNKPIMQDADVLVYAGVPYIPVRTAAKFCNYEVAVGKTGIAYLRTPMDNKQIEAASTYVTAIQNLWNELDRQRYEIDTDDLSVYREQLPKLLEILDEIKSLQRPDCQLLQYGYSQIDAAMLDIQTHLDGVEAGLRAGKSMREMQDTYICKLREGHVVDCPNWDGIFIASYEMARVLYLK